MKLPLRLILVAVLAIVSTGYTQVNMSFLALNADYATFRGSNDQTYTEIYLSFFQSELTYTIEDSMMIAHFSHRVKIMQDDSVLTEMNRNYKNSMPLGQKVTMYNRFMDVFPIRLDPGKYQIIALLNDDVANKFGEFRMDIDIPLYDSTLALSNIQLATRIEKSEEVNNFSMKNNMYILPNPSHIYGLLNPVLYFYFEGYNLKPDESGNFRYTYHYYIVDANDSLVRDFPVREKTSTGAVVAEASGTNVIALKNDTYLLKVDFTDLNSGALVTMATPFSIEKPTKEDVAARAPQPVQPIEDYSTYTEDELVEEFNKVRYIAATEERDVFDGLDADGMRRFLIDFWKRRDPNPSTPINEYKTMYMENVELANARYSSNFRPGWKTDRGRVLLIYGRPDEIERNPSSISTQPYEVWQYYSLDGGSEFIFGDLSGHGEYELIHSTYRNELQDPNWRERLGGSSFGPGTRY